MLNAMPNGVLVPAHDGAPLAAHDALGAWHFDPLVVVALVSAAWCYRRGWHLRGDGTGKASAFAVGLLAVALALLSPIDAIGGVLLTGHMLQHVLLITVAAPLLAFSTPSAAIQRGAPSKPRRMMHRARRLVGVDVRVVTSLRSPLIRWIVFVGTTWVWHAATLYEAAIDNDAVHALEHAMFIGTAWWFWSAILGPRRQRVTPGIAVLAVFTLSLQGAVLSMLMIFSTFSWYESYTESTFGWGLDPLADQQLAGVIMWLPNALFNAAVVIVVLTTWLRAEHRREFA